MKARLAVDAVTSAVARRGNVAGCVVHTDRGHQFRARKMVRALRHYGMIGSMGRVGAAGDNAATESFFSLLQENVLARRAWATREELRIATVTGSNAPTTDAAARSGSTVCPPSNTKQS